MSLSHGVRRENTTGGSSYRGYGASSVSVASGRSGQVSAGQQRTAPSAFQFDERQQQPQPYRHSLDSKPLPSPSAVSPPTSPTSRRIPSTSRGQPQPATPPKQPARSRTSVLIPDDKPLPLPGGPQQPHQHIHATPITGRKLPLQTGLQPQRAPSITTNLLDDEFGDLTPQAPTPRVSLYQGGGGGAEYTNGAGLPPEFALYQVSFSSLHMGCTRRRGQIGSASSLYLRSSSLPVWLPTRILRSGSTNGEIGRPRIQSICVMPRRSDWQSGIAHRISDPD